MFEIAVCDDNIQIVNQIEDLLVNYYRQLKVHIDTYSKGQELVDAVRAGKDYDIIFMDIEMETLDAGIRAGVEIKKLRCGHALIIFVTAHHELAIDTFYANPFRFLGKPFKADEFEQIIREAEHEISTKNKVFVYKVNFSVCRCAYRSIMYLKSNLRKIEIYGYQDKDEILRGSFNNKMDKVEAYLQKDNAHNFTRIHSSYIVNMDYVERFSQDSLVLMNNRDMLITDKYKKDAYRRLLRYLGKNYV